MTRPQRLHQLNKEIDQAIADKDFPSARLLSMERAELEKELNRRADLNTAKAFIASRQVHVSELN